MPGFYQFFFMTVHAQISVVAKMQQKCAVPGLFK